MELQNKSKIIELQGVNIVKIDCRQDVVEVWVTPDKQTQDCPCCGSHEVIRNGKDGFRKITHLPLCGKDCKIIAPKIRLRCKNCTATFAFQYRFVYGKQRYTTAFQANAYRSSIGSTVEKAAELLDTPYSTIERFFKSIVMKLAPLTESHAMEQALKANKLILGIDDFAIRKGHNYNTGIHDLRGETLMGIVKGRTLKELMQYASDNPLFTNLRPHAVVMDLAKQYHSFIAQLFPQALRVADRFHVNRYMIDALNNTRKRVSKSLASQAKLDLKRHKNLLNKRGEQLTKSEKFKINRLLTYSKELKTVYEYKEELAQWFDCSFNYDSARIAYDRWLTKGYSFKIPEIDYSLKTFENWKDEIINYHRCRFTNAIVEGRNNKIKSLQRRRFFLPNREYYEALISLECNPEIASILFDSLFT